MRRSRRGWGAAKGWLSLNPSAIAVSQAARAAESASGSVVPSGVSAGATAASRRSMVERSGSGSCQGRSTTRCGEKPVRGSRCSAVHHRMASSRASHTVNPGRWTAAR